MNTTLEHANITVSDTNATAAWMCDLFGWHIRWQGTAKNGGYTIHVGTEGSYLAIYTPASPAIPAETRPDGYVTTGWLNHIGVVVDDLAATEARVKAAGFTPYNHADYEPGQRFYFDDHDGIEYEVAQYG
ncbi:MAG: glyoxylase I family protein [Paracoccaceae bacterium]|jgi:glyoxylase I family protein